MPDDFRATVCIVALTYDEFMSKQAALPTSLQHELEVTTQYTVLKKGRIYSDSRNQWAPFIDGTAVKTYLDAAGLRPIMISEHIVHIDDLDRLTELLASVSIYIFDPLFVALETNCEILAMLQATIYTDRRKNFAILLPNRMPEVVRNELANICGQKLGLLRKLLLQPGGADRGIWEVESEFRLQSYLMREKVQRQPDRPPIPGNIDNLLPRINANVPQMAASH